MKSADKSSMNELSNLTDAELSQQLTDTRISLESIRPYRSKELENKQRQLRAEYSRRRAALNSEDRMQEQGYDFRDLAG